MKPTTNLLLLSQTLAHSLARLKQTPSPRAFSLCAASLLSIFCTSARAHAEFLQTSTLVYQDTNKRVKAVVGTKEGGVGIFVVSGPAIDPQEFDIEKTPPEGSDHLFIRFDESSQPPTYSEVVINNRSYKINGNLTIKVGDLVTIGIDNTNPYLTILSEESPGDPKASILGFSGTQEVVRGSGTATTSVLAANQLDRQVAEIIKPYTVKNNTLLINGKEVTTPTVGTLIQHRSKCLKPETVVLKADQLAQIRASKSEEQKVKVLQQFMSENKKSSPLAGHLVLKAESNAVVLLSMTDQNIRMLSSINENTSKRYVMCVISDVSGT
jgi:hypothetical protein